MKSNNAPEAMSQPMDHMTSAIAPSSSAREALAWMQRTGQRAAVVMDGDRPVGVITTTALRGPGTETSPRAEVRDVMDFDVVHVPPSFDLEDTLRAFRDAAWHSVRRRRPFAEKAAEK